MSFLCSLASLLILLLFISIYVGVKSCYRYLSWISKWHCILRLGNCLCMGILLCELHFLACWTKPCILSRYLCWNSSSSWSSWSLPYGHVWMGTPLSTPPWKQPTTWWSWHAKSPQIWHQTQLGPDTHTFTLARLIHLIHWLEPLIEPSTSTTFLNFFFS